MRIAASEETTGPPGVHRSRDRLLHSGKEEKLIVYVVGITSDTRMQAGSRAGLPTPGRTRPASPLSNVIYRS
ncbi:hypothetical protein EVAR_51587_1 [Eumeta japonica]|uniref:Uncharacterized protein n=1 Tax=Eumeta variegata TaxID=151549 RepID=A0A4C1YIN6_EUMVA|nr:hypothetical protein EVAR_51587_1 [Eumeta japonica]